MRPTSGYTPKNYSSFAKAPTPKAKEQRQKPEEPRKEEEEAPRTPQKKQVEEEPVGELEESPGRFRENAFHKRMSPQKKPLSEMGDDEFQFHQSQKKKSPLKDAATQYVEDIVEENKEEETAEESTKEEKSAEAESPKEEKKPTKPEDDPWVTSYQLSFKPYPQPSTRKDIHQ